MFTEKPGTYESYWNFYDKNVRFGNSLSCCIVVEEPLASIIPEEIDLIDRSRAPSKLVMSPKETNEYSKPLTPDTPTQSEIEDNKKEIGRVIIFPETAENVPITIPILKETRKLLYCSNLGSKLQAIEIPLSKGSQTHHKTEIDGDDEEKKLSNAEEFDCNRTALLKLSKMHQQRIFQQHFSNVPCPDENRGMATDFPVVDPSLSTQQQTGKGTVQDVTTVFADLSQGIENMHIVGSPSHPDSDSDWESVSELRVSNKYGINEKDLIVDFAEVYVNKNDETNLKEERAEKTDSKEVVNADEDNNNNNDKTVENNNSPRESISEISDASSDLSSGYDVVNVHACDEKEDESSGKVSF